MQKHILLMLVITVLIHGQTFSEEKHYPLEFQASLYPEEIRYGDICFIRFQVKNCGEEILLLPHGDNFRYTMRKWLLHDNQRVFPLYGYNYFESGPEICDLTIYGFSGVPVHPGETLDFHACAVWLPPIEFLDHKEFRKLKELLEQNETNYTISVDISYKSAYRNTSHRFFAFQCH